MTCTSCGHENAGGGVFCMRCGAPLQGLGAAPMAAAPAYTLPPEAAELGPSPISSSYAGFWVRFAAYMIDAIIVTGALTIIMTPVAIVIGILGATGAMAGDGANLAFLQGPLMLLWYGFSIAIQWLYEAFLTASSKQATFGKMALGLVVTDLDGRRLSFGRATGRFFAKIPSGLILMIGYIMQPFTEKKQALHDILAGTLVVKR